MVAEMMEGRGPLLSPGLDATGGRSYLQSSQTPGALGGRRAVQRWYTSGEIGGTPNNPNHMLVKITGGWWRIIGYSARVWDVPVGSKINIDIKVDVPGSPAAESIFETPPNIPDGELEAVGGILKEPRIYPVPYGTMHRIYPPGTGVFSFSSSSAGTLGEDLTVELHYKVLPVGQ